MSPQGSLLPAACGRRCVPRLASVRKQALSDENDILRHAALHSSTALPLHGAAYAAGVDMNLGKWNLQHA
eukprot:3778354-Amphidinium_carterae.1